MKNKTLREENKLYNKEIEFFGELRHKVRGVILKNIMELEQKRIERNARKLNQNKK